MSQGKLIAVIGSSGAGKTTLCRYLNARQSFDLGLESQLERPYQARFAADLHLYAFQNQMDYLILRGEQEADLRREPGVGLVDGGLDLDFWGFTRLFHQKGYLDADEWRLCERFYNLVRQSAPAPDLFIYLQASLETLRTRYTRRGRTLEITQLDDLAALTTLVDAWAGSLDDRKLMTVDVNPDGWLEDTDWKTLLLHALGGLDGK